MELVETGFDGLYIIHHEIFQDNRGLFVKTYNRTIFENLGIEIDIKERYYSVSNAHVIRGMHFQTPPEDHVKLVTVINGAILDVVLDIRCASPTFGKCFSIVINASDGKTVYIPKGFAHGFKALYDNTIVEYNQSTGYSQINDSGIHYKSFDFDWQEEYPTLSGRDLNFQNFNVFKSPF